MKTTLFAVTLASALALGTFGLYAHEDGHGGHGPRRFMHKGMALEHLTRDLDLTPQQQAQVKPIVEQARPQIVAIHEEARQKTRAIMENAATQIRPLLTAEQQQKFDALKKAREDMRAAMKEMHKAKMQ